MTRLSISMLTFVKFDQDHEGRIFIYIKIILFGYSQYPYLNDHKIMVESIINNMFKITVSLHYTSIPLPLTPHMTLY